MKELYKIITILIILTNVVGESFSQVIYSNPEMTAFEAEMIEHFTSKSESYYDFTDIINDFILSPGQLINLNNATDDELIKLNLNQLQIENIRNYLNQHGQLTSLFELNLIDGFDSTLIRRLEPHIAFTLAKEVHPISLRGIIQGKHALLLREQRILESQNGYAKPNPLYAGSPDKFLVKYSYNFYDRLKLGITLEKDAGEALRNGFDYASFHLLYKSKGMIRSLALGNYNVSFGQGLTIQSGFCFFTDPVSGAYLNQRNKITSSASVNEGQSLTGAGITLSPLRNTEISFFYSGKRLDARTSSFTDSTQLSEFEETEWELPSSYVESIIETGLHRTPSEIERKNRLSQTVIGTNVNSRFGVFRIGSTIVCTSFDQNLKRKESPYNIFDFNGRQLLNYGFDGSINYRSLSAFAECSGSDNGAMAMIAGLSIFQQNMGFTLLYRNYDEQFQSFFSNSYSQGNGCRNERGIYTAINSTVNKSLKISAGVDLFEFPWMKYRISSPSVGSEYFLRNDLLLTDRTTLIARYSFMKKMQNPVYETENLNDSVTTHAIVPVTHIKHSFRFEYIYKPLNYLVLRNRIDYSLIRKETEKKFSSGFLLLQDIEYHKGSSPLKINIRYALFDTDTFDNRIYAYENDLLYSYSVPPLSGRGSRFYTMIRYDMSKFLILWFKYSITTYLNRSTVGTGHETSSGPHRSELKLQLQVKF